MTIDHTVQRPGMPGDEISVNIERFAIDNELEGGGGVDTARRVRECPESWVKVHDGVPFAPVRHDVQLIDK